ncbi:MAG: DUF2484 family protein [Rhodobacteraceae bacterium]|uniref:DUF2484 family protein n=1 Tax=Albidovulum sp. TaxID=1872424 RepID=UPI001DE538B5|nr:DUF2484 family protein [uncultured Defluviimonas sp.]MCB2126255.1 DUF2484 family protein [Paracoccaceae bacterium]MCC0069870.1 DUF2484 family protein [Paracoccaceae bacterium]
MTAPIVAACLWVVAATAVAFLPMRFQRIVGLPLVASALLLIVWLSRAVSPWIGVAALAAFVSMFRKPLGYFAKRLLGKDQAR